MKTNTLKIILLTAALTATVFFAQAQDKKISQLPALPSVSGSEAIPLATSGTNYYLTPTQLKTWLNIVGYVPLAGTLNSAPLTGTIEYRGTNGIALVDTIAGNTLLMGSGNLKDLNSATKKSIATFSGNSSHSTLSLSSSSSIGNTSLTLKDNLFSLGISNNSNSATYGFTSAVAGFGIFATDATGAYTTKLNTTPSAILLQSSNPTFAGATYNADYSANFTARSLIDKGYADATYAPIISGGYIPLAGTTSGNALTGTIEFDNSVSGKDFVFWKNVSLGGTFYLGTTDNKTFTSASHGSFSQYSDGQIIQNAFNESSDQGVLNLTTGGSEISCYSSGVSSRFFQVLGQTYVQSTYTNYSGFTYETATAGYVATNGGDYQLFHRLYNDARYAPITAVLSGTGYVKQLGGSTSYIASIPNADLANSTFTVNGTGMALGTSSIITADASTLTNTILNSTIVASSLTTVGTVTTGVWNAKIQPRTGTVTTASVITINSDNYDIYTVTSLSTATTFTTPSGTPKQGQGLLIRIKDNGTARALSFTTGSSGSFRFSSDQTAPTTTLSKTMYIYAVYNADDNRWDCTGWRDNY